MDRFRQSSVSSSAAATSKRAAIASAVPSFKSASRSASHAQGLLAEASAVVLSASVGAPGFNGEQECKLRKANAITAVGSIIKGEISPFELVDAAEFHRLGKASLKMPSWLKGFESQWDYLCCTGHRAQHTGYVVCSICCSSLKKDSWRDGVLTLGTTGGNSSLIRHAKGHLYVSRNSNSIPTTRMTNALTKAAVPAVMLYFQTYGRLEGRGAKEFALALLQAGQRFPPNFSFDSEFVSALLPSRSSLTRELSLIAAENRKKDATKLLTWFRYGGGGSTDGWKSDINGKNFYDLTLYFVPSRACDIQKFESSRARNVQR
jgi:hypothetical protein